MLEAIYELYGAIVQKSVVFKNSTTAEGHI